MVARMVKHVFTGNLNSTIDSCPPFPGKERHLLRCQIARITHATEICPKGLYEIDEET
jgi:radial spoke head protein 4/6